MLKKIGRILLGVLLVSLMIATCIYIIISNNSNSKSKSAGTITVIVNTIDNEIVDKRRVDYNEGDTLFEVINKEYELGYDLTMYGHFLTGIKNDSFNIETDGFSSWLWLELAYLKEGNTYSDSIDFDQYNCMDSNVGIDGIELVDNMILGINQRDDMHNASIFNQNVSFEKTDPNLMFNCIFKIIIIVISSLFLLSIIIYIIVSRKTNNPITIKEVCILAFMTVILFVQEELLTFIPNFQFSFLLIAVYTKVFGFKKTSLIVFAHVLLDNLFMGSLLPFVFIPMLIGYYLYMMLIYLVRNKHILFITLMGVIGSLIYCYLFLITNVLFLEVDAFTYWIMDIPFEILLALSTVFTLFYLYIPISNKLSNLVSEKDYTNQQVE